MPNVPDPPLPESFSAAAALAAGLTRDQIRQRVRNGQWIRVGKGQYVKAHVVERPDLDEYARERVHHAARAAAARRRHPGSFIAFESAAVIHHLPLWEPLPRSVRLLVGPGRWTGEQAGALLRYAPLPAHHTHRAGPPVTTPARTWLDIARTSGLAQALTVGDAGVRQGLFTIADLEGVLAEGSALRGRRRAAAALALVDGRRESPLESASWAYFVENAVPFPEPQRVLLDARGRFVGRVDFWWERARLVGECDGRLKYAAAADLYAEKRREDQIRALGHSVVRWGVADLRSPRLAARLRGLIG